MTADDLIWVGGMTRETADFIFNIVAKQAVSRERERMRLLVSAMIEREGSDTGHAKAKTRAWKQILDLMSE